MLEYVFFREASRKRFQAFLEEQGLGWTVESSDTETLVVIDESAMDHGLADRVESLYDELFELEREIYQPRRPPPPTQGQLPVPMDDGRTLHVELPAETLGRLQAAIAPGDLETLARAIASALKAG